MPIPEPKRYVKEGEVSDYRHTSHAGNIGDVFKHLTLGALLLELSRGTRPVHYFDLFAGEGVYNLQATGEWSEGIGALLRADDPPRETPLAWYRDSCAPLFATAPRQYPGSPLLLARGLRPMDTLTCAEINPAAFAALENTFSRVHIEHRERCSLLSTPALEVLAQECQRSTSPSDQSVFFLDPPWSAKGDWEQTPRALLSAWRSAASAMYLLWFPIKSYTRVNAMTKMLAHEGLPFTVLELITTPLEYQRNRLNGSGMLLVNVPPAVVRGVSTIGTLVGSACATQRGYYQYRVFSWNSLPEKK